MGEFMEILVGAPFEVCETRDPMGLYVKARSGELANVMGLESPYEPPEEPDQRNDPTRTTYDVSADQILRFPQASWDDPDS